MTQRNPHSVFPDYKDKYYVYMLLRPDNRVFYVGKGKSGRINDHFRPQKLKSNSVKSNIINKYGVSEIKRQIISYHDTEDSAYDTEEYLIASYGVMAEGGILCNVSKTRTEYPERVAGYIAKKEPSTPNKYSVSQVEEAHRLYYQEYLDHEQVSNITSISVNYLYYILSGKKCKGVYESEYVQQLVENYDPDKRGRKEYKSKHPDAKMVQVLEMYYLENLYIGDIVEKSGIAEEYVRNIVQGQKRSYLLKEFKEKHPQAKRKGVKEGAQHRKDIVADLRTGMTVSEVVKKYNSAKTTVHRFASQEGITFESKPKIPDDVVVSIYEDYFLRGIDAVSIHDRTGVNLKYIKSLLKGRKRKRSLETFIAQYDLKEGMGSGTGKSTGNNSATNSDNAA